MFEEPVPSPHSRLITMYSLSYLPPAQTSFISTRLFGSLYSVESSDRTPLIRFQWNTTEWSFSFVCVFNSAPDILFRENTYLSASLSKYTKGLQPNYSLLLFERLSLLFNNSIVLKRSNDHKSALFHIRINSRFLSIAFLVLDTT